MCLYAGSSKKRSEYNSVILKVGETGKGMTDTGETKSALS